MMCLPFFHKYKVVNARRGKEGDLGYPLTCVSYVCKKCGKPKSVIIKGHFTIEDLTLHQRYLQ